MFTQEILVRVFEALFLTSTSLESVASLLRISILDSSCRKFLTSKLLDEYVVELVKNIRHEFENPLPLNGLSEAARAKLFLQDLHYFGDKIRKTLLPRSIIAGSFALSLKLFMQQGDIVFMPNDVDLYFSRENQTQICRDLCSKWINGVIKDNSSMYIRDERYLRSTRDVIDMLSSNYKQYDWDSLLSKVPHVSSSDIYEVKSFSFDSDTKDSFINDMDLVIMESEFYDSEHFAGKICDDFDMDQCRIAIIDIEGTFFPYFFHDEATRKSIKERMITFNNPKFLTNFNSQMQRVEKYRRRGFELKKINHLSAAGRV